MNEVAYDQGCVEALVRFKVASSHTDTLKMLAAALGIPLAAGGVAAATAEPGQRLSDGLATGAGSALGGLAGGTAGALAGMSAGTRKSPGDQRGLDQFLDRLIRRPAQYGLMGGAAGLGLGQLGGAALGHAAHKSWQGKDKPGPASPGEKTESKKKD